MNDFKGAWDEAMAPNYGTPSLCITHGAGAHVTDSHGRTYVDLLAGVAVNALGHRHPNVARAVQQQSKRLWHASNLYANPATLALAQQLRDLTGMKSLFVNSGTEANEAALKLVRSFAHDRGRPNAVVVAFEGSFHGRTSGSLALTGQSNHQRGFAPLPGQVIHVPFNDERAIEAVFEAHDVAGVFFEPVQGEGGVHPMNASFAATLQRLANAHDTILVADEVQTGIGRTGRFWGHDWLPIQPHIITAAKGMGGGWPIGVCLIHDELADLLGPGSHGCTFGGHPVAAAAASATLDTVASQDLAARANTLGERAKSTAAKHGISLRGNGLLLGVELETESAREVVSAMQERGFLVGTAGPFVVRLAPPLIIDEDLLNEAIEALASAIGERELPIPA